MTAMQLTTNTASDTRMPQPTLTITLKIIAGTA